MAKSALGRGLGQLMNGDKVAGSTPSATPENPPQEDLWGRGVQTLLEPKQPSKTPAATPAVQPQTAFNPDHQLSIPSWFFFGADLLMLALALVLVIGPKPLPTINVVLALLATVLGCFSAIVGVACARRRPRDPNDFRR